MKFLCNLFIIAASTLLGDHLPVVSAADAPSPRGKLISFSKKLTVTKEGILLNTVTDPSDFLNTTAEQIQPFLKYDVDVYLVIYQSIYNTDEEKALSGLVFIPRMPYGDMPLGINQYHHGTVIPGQKFGPEYPNLDLGPSASFDGTNNANIEYHFTACTFASNGYVVPVPDYAGYGVTVHLDHPYLIHKESAESSIDMIRATRQLLAKLNDDYVYDDKKVFLTGWSQGGSVAMATHKYMELQYAEEFDIKAVSFFAGAYNYSVFPVLLAAQRDTVTDWTLGSWTFYAINKFSRDLQRPTDEIFTFDASTQAKALAPRGEVPLTDVLRNDFLDGVENGSDEVFLRVAVENSLLDTSIWTPQVPVFLHHGTADSTVDFFHSEQAYDAFTAAGVSVNFYPYVNAGHFGPNRDYVFNSIKDFAIVAGSEPNGSKSKKGKKKSKKSEKSE